MMRPAQLMVQRSVIHLPQFFYSQMKPPVLAQVKPLSPSSSSEVNNAVLATKDQLHRVELGLLKDISGLREGLTKEISGVESRLTEKIYSRNIRGPRRIDQGNIRSPRTDGEKSGSTAGGN